MKSVADKGYDTDALRNFLNKKGVQPQIPRKRNAEKTGAANARQCATISSRTHLLMAPEKVPAARRATGTIARLFRCVFLLETLLYLSAAISGIGSYKGKVVLIHLVADADGMPMAACSAPVNEDERKHAGKLIETVSVKTGKAAQKREKVGGR